MVLVLQITGAKNAELRNDFEVWAIDLLGFGRSAKPNWQYSGDLWPAI